MYVGWAKSSRNFQNMWDPLMNHHDTVKWDIYMPDTEFHRRKGRVESSWKFRTALNSLESHGVAVKWDIWVVSRGLDDYTADEIVRGSLENFPEPKRNVFRQIYDVTVSVQQIEPFDISRLRFRRNRARSSTSRPRSGRAKHPKIREPVLPFVPGRTCASAEPLSVTTCPRVIRTKDPPECGPWARRILGPRRGRNGPTPSINNSRNVTYGPFVGGGRSRFSPSPTPFPTSSSLSRVSDPSRTQIEFCYFSLGSSSGSRWWEDV